MGSHGPDDYIRPEYVEVINGVDTVVTNSNPLVQTPTGYDQINFMQKAQKTIYFLIVYNNNSTLSHSFTVPAAPISDWSSLGLRTCAPNYHTQTVVVLR